MNVNIVSVDVEVKKPGARGWSLANIKYTLNGETKWQNVASFKAPAVFKDVQNLIGETVEVTVGKNEKGYDEWTAVKPTGAAGATNSSSPAQTTGNTTATRVTGSNFETPVERAKRQVLIVRQSSITAALTVLKNDENLNLEKVFETAQEIVDWVFDEEPVSEDVPY